MKLSITADCGLMPEEKRDVGYGGGASIRDQRVFEIIKGNL